MTKPYISWFEEVGSDSVGLVGGKGANLGEMLNARLPVPYGFIVTSHAYFYFLKYNDLEPLIREILDDFDYEDQKELSVRSEKIQNLIKKAPFPPNLQDTILDFYEKLPLKENKMRKNLHPSWKETIAQKLTPDTLVAIRSSATAEDLPTASFAGQQETYLNIQGENVLLEAIRNCMASLFTQRAIYYRHEQGFDHFKVGLASVVQRMVQSDRSGIAFSLDPVTNDKTKVVIEAIFGLGEYIVQGKVTPDHYEVNKSDFNLISKDINFQKEKFIKHGHENISVALNHEVGSTQKLSDEEVIDVARVVVSVEEHYNTPQDIEWAIENDMLFVVQSRPITTQNQNSKNQVNSLDTSLGISPILTGDPASPGVAVGKPVVLTSPSENNKIHPGDILIAKATNPDYVPAMRRAGGIVTEQGGRTSHAAIVAREFGIPAIVGATEAISKLEDLYEITVHGDTGKIYQGNIKSKFTSHEVSHSSNEKKLPIKVYLNCAETELLEKYSKLPVDGIGLLRAEFMLASFGIHPQFLIDQGKGSKYKNFLSENLIKFAKAFEGKPVVYRATDFKTNEYSHLEGGTRYEQKEENPMLGFRGTSRYLVNRESFRAEIEGFLEAYEKHTNLILMLPFIRTPYELVAIKQDLAEFGFYDFKIPPKLWIMVEVPSTVITLETFMRIGIDGLSIGTNDLTMLTLGVDRDNAKVAHLYEETNRSVMWMLEHIVTTAKKWGVTASVCGQAVSDSPEIVKSLISWGVTSVSVSPDAVDKTRELISSI